MNYQDYLDDNSIFDFFVGDDSDAIADAIAETLEFEAKIKRYLGDQDFRIQRVKGDGACMYASLAASMHAIDRLDITAEQIRNLMKQNLANRDAIAAELIFQGRNESEEENLRKLYRINDLGHNGLHGLPLEIQDTKDFADGILLDPTRNENTWPTIAHVVFCAYTMDISIVLVCVTYNENDEYPCPNVWKINPTKPLGAALIKKMGHFDAIIPMSSAAQSFAPAGENAKPLPARQDPGLGIPRFQKKPKPATSAPKQGRALRFARPSPYFGSARLGYGKNPTARALEGDCAMPQELRRKNVCTVFSHFTKFDSGKDKG